MIAARAHARAHTRARPTSLRMVPMRATPSRHISLCVVIACIQLMLASAAGPDDVSSLEELFQQHGTDKQAMGHAYVHAYSMLLGPWRHDVRSLLEVGIGTVNSSFSANMGAYSSRRKYMPGASLRSWRAFLPNARIVGLDLDASAARAAADPQQRLEAYGVDTTSAKAVAALDLTEGGKKPFDVIIDDGLHTWAGQQATLLTLWPLVREGGFYFIEDVLMGDIMKHATPGGPNPAMGSTSPQALAILREGGGYALSLDAFWGRLSKRRYSSIIALQKPKRDWPRLYGGDKGIPRESGAAAH